MKNKVDIEDYKKIVNDILKYIKTVCKENEITYYLAYGTLLGAIRHHGFIPWDDDIDIIMDRKNFEKLVELCNKSDHPYYKLMWLSEDSEYDLPLPKMVDTRTELKQARRKSNITIGAWVDILIIDDVRNNLKAQNKFLRKFDFYERCWNWSQYTDYSITNAETVKGFLGNIFVYALSLFGSKFWARKLYKCANKHNGKGYTHFSSLVFSGGKRKAYRKEWLGNGCEVEFEGEKYNAPEHWHEYLQHAYGDYMEFPPPEKRVAHHTFSVYYK